MGVPVQGWLDIRTLGLDGVRGVSEQAVLNANYLLALLKDLSMCRAVRPACMNLW